MSSTRRAPLIALVVVTVLAAAAVAAGAQTTTAPASSGNAKEGAEGATTATNAPSTAVRGVTPTSIRVAGLGTTGIYGDAQIGAKARFERTNAEGGVNGRTITFQGLTDDGGTADGNKAAATALIDGGVFAVVPAVAADMASANDLVNAQVPYFGWALSSEFCGNGYGFGFSGCIAARWLTTNIWGRLVKQSFTSPNPLGNTAAVLTDNSPAGRYALKAATAGLEAAGLEITYARASLPVPPSGDYGAVVKGVLVSNESKAPRAIFVVGSYSNVAGVQQVLRDASYFGTFTNLVQYDPNLVAQASGASVFVQAAPTEAAGNTSAMRQLVADVRKVAPAQPINQSVIAGYLSADLFLAAVKKAGPDLTVGKLIGVANARFTYQLPGVAGPTKFPAGHDRPTPCGSLVRSNGTSFQIAAAYTCGRIVKVPK